MPRRERVGMETDPYNHNKNTGEQMLSRLGYYFAEAIYI